MTTVSASASSAGSNVATGMTASGMLPGMSGDDVLAGSVVFAVLDTGINSDDSSPIMATIIEGQLKGSKLLGSFKRNGQTVTLSFCNIE